MITVDDKLKLFKKEIIDNKQKEYDNRVHELDIKLEEDFIKHKEGLEKERKEYEESLLYGVKLEKKKRLSEAKNKKRRAILKKRKEMIDSLMLGVIDYTKEFVKTEEYYDYLKWIIYSHISDISSLGGFTFYVNERDSAFKDEIITICKENNLSCMDGKVEEMIGGIIFISEDNKCKLDFSLDSIIEDEDIYIGNLIYNMLVEEGDIK